MKKNRNISRIIAVLLVLAMMLSNVSMMVFSADSPCAEDGCSGTYRNGICSASGHYEAAPIEEGVYRISNAGQLYWFAALVNAGANEFGGDNGEVYNAVLTADIIINADMSAEDKLQWTPIGLYTSGREYVRYSGTFDGNGKTICGLYYDNTNYDGRNAGLFGTVDSNGVVKNLTLADSVINGATEIGGIASYNYGDILGCTQSGSVTGTGATGGIVCRNLGVVENCVNTGAVSGSTTGGIAAENNGEVVSCENSGVINGTNSVGGIVGMNDGSVEDSLNTANVTASGTHVGGVVGNLVGGGIVGSGNTGNVTGASDYIGGVAGVCSAASITESYNTGAVIGNTGKSEAVGGVVGAIDGTNLTASSITSCYNTGAVSGRSWVGGIAGISGYQKTPQPVTFSNGYTTGAVSGSSNTGAVVGKLSKGTVSGIYYLQGAQNSVSGATAATAEQFASGEIAFELNTVSNVWFQALDIEGIEPDASPVLDETHGVVREGYANCTEPGYTNRENYNEPGDHVDEDWDQVCDKCGAILGEPHEHDFSDWTRTKEPTCSAFGEETRICSICNYPQKRQVEKLPHTEETIPGVPSTFDETGLTEGKRCTVCGEITVAQETAPVLDYNEGIIPIAALAVTAGDSQSGEGPERVLDDSFDTLWHTNWNGISRDLQWIQFEITEDYDVTGLRYKPRSGSINGVITKYDIQVSDDGVTFTSVASGDWANNTNWKIVEFDAQTVRYVRLVSVESQTDSGKEFSSAAEIRLTGAKSGSDSHQHSWSDWTVTTEPTCTEAGVETRTCECGETQTRAIDALGHNYVDGICTRCGEAQPVVSEKITGITGTASSVDDTEPAHNKDVGNAFDGDYNTFWATVPGGTLADCYLIADLGGAYTIDKVEYTKRYDSGAQYDCTGNLLDYIIEVSTDGETWTQVAAGATVNGTTEITFEPVQATHVRLRATQSYHWQASSANTVMCAAELAVYGIAYVAHEHTPAEAVRENEVAATCTTAGSYDSVVYCATCGEEISRQTVTVDALGHDFVDGKCTRCGEEQEQPVTNPFTDVPEDSFYYEPVLWAVENGVTTGATATTFNPNGISMRGQIVTFLWRAAGSPEPETTENPFVDVKESDYFYKAVLWAYENEITKGVDDTHFAPTLDCTRAQVVTFLWRAKGSQNSTAVVEFTDVEADKYYTTAVAWAVENGITTGMGDGTFGVNVTCNRAYAVTFLYRAFAE